MRDTRNASDAGQPRRAVLGAGLRRGLGRRRYTTRFGHAPGPRHTDRHDIARATGVVLHRQGCLDRRNRSHDEDRE
jgi:hypothetical protein